MALRINGPALRTIRERTGLTTTDLVTHLENDHNIKVGIRHISNLERGAIGASPGLLKAIAAVLKIQQSAILADPQAERISA
ncbi:MAG TPA: helix-turn-helix domain-containing protein [Actinokineospora sp.]|jgi:transcriptional regulator with XRE-family HTH domain|nr:helix-turn-helix domain-containing protein [Actinokineospora sp.]